MEELQQKGALAKEASIILAKKSSEEKNKGLIKAADFLLQYKDEIIKANEIDL